MFDVKDFQHSEDSAFAGKIFSNSTVQSVLKKFKETNIEGVYTYLYQSSCPQLTEKTSPEIFKMLAKACKMFGLEKIPSVYVTRNYDEMVSVRGINEPFLVFSSEYLRKLEGETLFGILASQVAAIRCRHHMILYITWGVDFASGLIPGASIVITPLINDWMRCRYFTYDRTFCLATKNRALALRQVLLNVVPKNILDEMQIATNQDVYLAQAEKFLETMNNSRTQAVIKKAISMYSYKIWLPERYAEINKFFAEGRF